MSGQPNVSDLQGLYANRFSEQDRLQKEVLWRTLCKCFLQSYLPPDASVLDLGAGYCDFLNNIEATRKVAVDLNQDTQRYAGPDVEVHQLGLERMGEAVGPGTMDVVFASNVFEHLRGPDALIEILSAARVVLRPGGIIMILQPNIRLVGASFWDFVDHTLPLTEKGMEEALTMSGFAMVERRARFLPYTTKGRFPKSSLLLRLYLVMRPLQWLLGKQMFLVARRPNP